MYLQFLGYLSCGPFPKVFLCFSLEQMFVTPKISLHRLTRARGARFPRGGGSAHSPSGKQHATWTALGTLPLAVALAACFGYFLLGFPKWERSSHWVVGHVLGVSSSLHLKFAWEMSFDGVVLLFLNFDYGRQIKQIPFFLLKLAWFGFLSLFKN